MANTEVWIIKRKAAAKIISASLAPSASAATKKKKKDYDRPGQKYDTPPSTDPLARFYTSLLAQRPNSEMALKWCLERGLLSKKRATEALLVLETLQKMKLK